MKNSYEQSLSDSTTDLDNPSSFFQERFSSEAGIPRKGNHGWLSLALVTVLIIIFVILAILAGVLFGHYATMVDELTVLKYNVSNSKSDTSDLWKSVDNIMGDISKMKTKVDTTGGSCISCPPGWKLIHNFCYFFEFGLKSWEKSREKCATRNGVLLIMKDIHEMNALLPTIGEGRFWMGLKRSSEDTDRWVWADETPLKFSAWNEGEPNNDRDKEHCAEIIGSLQAWNDRDCKGELGYICKGVWAC